MSRVRNNMQIVIIVAINDRLTLKTCTCQQFTKSFTIIKCENHFATRQKYEAVQL